MSRIGKRFRQLRKQKKKAFIPYIMAGDPHIQSDGPTIQMAAQRALSQGISLDSVLTLVGDLRVKTQIPIILMTYYNPIYKYGEQKFISDASSAGVDGIIVPDLPPDEAGELIALSKKTAFDVIFLLAPTSTEDRIRKVAKLSGGFIYYVSITGITGSKLSMDSSISSHIASIKSISGKPVAVGFGISSPSEATTVSAFADGVIVGSAIVKRAESPDDDLKEYLLSLRGAIQ
jgi:tryptophan synthase alpha chain